jgi:bifunctional DNase/RNase
MTTVRIAHVEPKPGRLPGGGFQTRGYLVVLADDARRRAVPVWLAEPAAGDLARLVELAARPAEEAASSGAPQELAARLLRAAGAQVTSVDIDEIGPEVTGVRIELASHEGTRHVLARLPEGIAVAITAGVPIRVADALMDRLATPAPGTPGQVRCPSRQRATWLPGRGPATSRAT